MNTLLDKFGIVESELQSSGFLYPPVVPNRVAHIDADFLAYQCACPTKDELTGLRPMRTFEQMKEKADAWVLHLQRAAGAMGFVCHVTPNASNKGGRRDQAVQKEYQGNRKDREAPEYLESVRSYIVSSLNGIPHLDQEADDGLAQAGYHDPNAVICSADKDLMMVPGWHLDMSAVDKEAKVFYIEPNWPGSLYMNSRNELKGFGPMWFFAQCLKGDPADSIQGAPGVPNIIMDQLDPPALLDKLKDTMRNGKTERSRLTAANKIAERHHAFQLCGDAKAYKILCSATSIRQAFERVKYVFTSLEANCGYQFKHWQTGENVTPQAALLGDMRTLWMRRNNNPDDVLDWLRENM